MSFGFSNAYRLYWYGDSMYKFIGLIITNIFKNDNGINIINKLGKR